MEMTYRRRGIVRGILGVGALASLGGEALAQVKSWNQPGQFAPQNPPPPQQQPYPQPNPNDRAAAAADYASADDAVKQLGAARDAIIARRVGLALELLERAESRLLTRSTPVWRTDRPVERGPVARIAIARGALQRGDFSTALGETDAAIAMVRERMERFRR